ncbi:MAG: hypothetical protein U0528_10100 [Anaerolineae bacterium]
MFLDEHYRISLTGLSHAELQALFVESKTRPLADLGLERAEEATLLKLFAALPSVQQAEVERLRSRFFIDPANWFQVIEIGAAANAAASRVGRSGGGDQVSGSGRRDVRGRGQRLCAGGEGEHLVSGGGEKRR